MLYTNKILFVLLALLLSTGAPSALAQSDSGPLETNKIILDAISAMEAGNYDVAKPLVDSIINETSYGDVLVLKIIIENRLGNYEEAIKVVETDNKNHSEKNPIFHLEAAFAYIKLDKPAPAIDHLNTYLQDQPNHAKANELLARAYALQGNFEESRKYYKTAKQLDSSIDVPDRKTLLAITAPESYGEFKNWATINFGYNDNVVILGENQPLPAGITDKGAFYTGLLANLGYVYHSSGSSSIAINYQGSFRFYEDLSQFNSQFHRISGVLQHKLSDKLGISLLGEVNDYLLDGDDLRTQFVLKPDLYYRWNKKNRSLIEYRYTDSDYKFDSLTPALDRDSDNDDLSLSHELAMTSSRLTLGLNYQGNTAKGTEDDYTSYGIFGQYNYWLQPVKNRFFSGRPVIQVSGSYADKDYDNSSVFSVDTSTRKDDVGRYGLALYLPVNKKVSFNIRYFRIDNNSNVPFYDYSTNDIGIGILGRF